MSNSNSKFKYYWWQVNSNCNHFLTQVFTRMISIPQFDSHWLPRQVFWWQKRTSSFIPIRIIRILFLQQLLFNYSCGCSKRFDTWVWSNGYELWGHCSAFIICWGRHGLTLWRRDCICTLNLKKWYYLLTLFRKKMFILCLIKCSREILQNLPYFRIMKNPHCFFFFHSVLLYIFI